MRIADSTRSTSGACKSSVTFRWDYDECTHRSASAIDRLSRQAAKSVARRVVLDMSGCTYVSITGLRSLMEWAGQLSNIGKELRISGLNKLQSCIFTLSGLDWLLVDNN